MGIRLLCCSGSLDGGGSERQLWQLACNLDISRFAPQLYLLYRRGNYLGLVPEHIKVDDFWSNRNEAGFWLPGQIHHLQRTDLRRVIERDGVELVYDRNFHMTLVTAPACRAAGVPRVSVIVSPPSRDFVRSRERFAWQKKRALHRAYSDPSSKVVAVSAAVAEDAADFYGLDLSSLEVIPNPVDAEGVIRQADECNVASTNANSFRVAVVGRLSSEKGQKHALAAFARTVENHSGSGQWQMDVVGDGPDRIALEQLAKRMGIEKAVHFHGFLSNPYGIIQQADLLLIPSDYEGLPNVALEAMVLRTPVVATECSDSLRQLIGEGERGQLVPLGDVDAMTRAINSCSSDRMVWEQRVEQAADYVQRNHGLAAWLQRMEELFWASLETHARGGKA